jgi:hypothetical protein
VTDSQTALTRRNLLAGAGLIGAGLVASACGTNKARISGADPTPAAGNAVGAPPPLRAAPTRPAVKAAPSAQDVQIAQLAAGLEVLAVGTYKAALDAATAGSLGTVPPAVAEFATVAMQHHQAHLDAWNKVLTTNGAQSVTAPNATLKPTVDQAFAGVKDVAGVAMLAVMLEQIAAATYLSAQGVLTDKDAIKLAGSIQIVDAQHVSVLLFVMGMYPVPDTFAKVDMAAAPGGTAAPAPSTDTTGAMPDTK